MKKILNIAHRGFSGKYPENSRAAFEAAFKLKGCDGVESDVHLTKDGEPVIIHDDLVDRTTDGKGMVCDYTFKEIRKLDCGGWFNKEFSGERIMHLDELIELMLEHDSTMNIEIKNYLVFYEGIEEIVLKSIDKYKARDKIFLSSFNHFAMNISKKIDPQIRTGYLMEYPMIAADNYVAENGMDAFHPAYQWLFYKNDPDIVARMQSRGINVNTWTVNEKADMQACVDLGVNGIITNYPDRLIEVLK